LIVINRKIFITQTLSKFKMAKKEHFRIRELKHQDKYYHGTIYRMGGGGQGFGFRVPKSSISGLKINSLVEVEKWSTGTMHRGRNRMAIRLKKIKQTR
jgi:hypothetical protein